MDDHRFKNAFGTELSGGEIAKEVLAFMRAEPDRTYMVTIGTDSEQYQKTGADFVTAIVVHRVGNGGRYFWRRAQLKNFHTMRDRILHEVMTSLEVAKEAVTHLKELNAPEFGLEIHIDVGENGESKKMIQELVGMIRANNFEARTKPESYAASSVADRHV